MSFLSYQAELRDALFASDAAVTPSAALGPNPERWKVYRRMVRSRFAESIEHGFQRLHAAVGDDRFREIVERFLAESPPRTHYLREVPQEFLQFFERNQAALASAYALPAYALDLARYEWAELETAYSFGERSAAPIGPFDMNLVPVLSPAHRLIDVSYPVHRISTDGSDEAMRAAPFSLCLYRERASHDVAVLELTPVTASMLSLMQGRSSTLTEIVRNAAESVGVTVDIAFVEALSTLLADLIERGVLLGSLVPKETS
ncbi:MAG TPA: putative DNA-binding domain-containing protein [Polyangiaceae bacterium]|nr:putative DNA-binding domain-containing protein [Polyangiaceae bacterium]